jgi:4'-phosphopantetheinyl transferase EntD
VDVVEGSDQHGDRVPATVNRSAQRRQDFVAGREAARAKLRSSWPCRVARFQTVAARRLRGVK